MNSNTLSVPVAGTRERLLHVFALIGGFTWAADFLFWNQPLGISVALCAAIAAGVLCFAPGSERPAKATWVAASLLFVSSWATCLEISFSNGAVLVALLAVIMGERHFREIAGSWARWTESLVAWAGAAGRWPWLFRSVRESELANVGFNTVTSDRAARSVQILAPAAGLAMVFVVVLSLGNAVFRQLLAHFDAAAVAWVSSFDFSVPRMMLWGLFATFALALVQPRPVPTSPRFWTRPVSRISRADHTVAIWQSGAVLVVLNGLFFVVNTIDVIYLWGGNGRTLLPEGVTYSEFVHQGVYSLIFAVLLSAVVMAFIFQQDQNVSQRRMLKILAGAWIAQNLLLISGVVLRLKLYVQAYQLSELRVYVGCFLLLVVAGYCLLAVHIAKNESLGTLLWRNVLATFVLFLVIQFPDVKGYVARFNVAQWKRDSGRVLDIAYFRSMGPGAWPALCEVSSSTERDAGTVREAREIVKRLADAEIDQRSVRGWRSYQARRSAQGLALIRESQRLYALP